jgi:lysophospholipase L1-like esterase
MLTANDFRSFDLRSSPVATPHDPHAYQIQDTERLQRVAVAELVTLGDSWLFKYPFGLRPSLTSSLEKLGYFAANSHRFGTSGARLQEMASASSLDKLRNCFQNPNPFDPAPQALLIGGGGNDVVYRYDVPTSTPLYKMLRQAPAAGVDPLIEDEVHAFIDIKIADLYRTILNSVVGLTGIPILIHDYDHSIPDGRRDPASGPWLAPIFAARGISMPLSQDVTRRLIDRVGAMVATVAAEYPGRVSLVKTAGTLEQDPRYKVDYKLLWANELHPNEDGYDLLAKVVAKQLKDDHNIG